MTEQVPPSPIDAALGDTSRCRVFAPDVSVHWYPTPDALTCYCGECHRTPA